MAIGCVIPSSSRHIRYVAGLKQHRRLAMVALCDNTSMLEGAHPLGARVSTIGVIVGRSEFSEGPASYLVKYESRGKLVRSWFIGEDMIENGLED